MLFVIENKIFGDVPKWLKGPDSKSGRSVLPALGFKSLHLRHKITLTLIKRVKVIFLPIFKGFRTFLFMNEATMEHSDGDFFVVSSF